MEQKSIPAPDGTPPTSEALAGIWAQDPAHTDGDPLLVRFGTDGTMAFDNNGELDVPAVPGSYELQGDTIVFSINTSAGWCPGGSTTFKAGSSEDGRLHTVVAEASCLPDGTEWHWVRVSPQSAASAVLAQDPSGTPHPPLVGSLKGIWLLEGTGLLMLVDATGRYAIDDGGTLTTDPDDSGAVEAEGTTVKLTSDGSRSCAVGDTNVWEGAQLFSFTLTAVAKEAGCANQPSGDQTWIRLSP